MPNLSTPLLTKEDEDGGICSVLGGKVVPRNGKLTGHLVRVPVTVNGLDTPNQAPHNGEPTGYPGPGTRNGEPNVSQISKSFLQSYLFIHDHVLPYLLELRLASIE